MHANSSSIRLHAVSAILAAALFLTNPWDATGIEPKGGFDP